MNGFVRFIHFFQAQMSLPLPWEAWHLCSFALTIILSVVLGIVFRKMGNNGLRIFLIIVSSILIIFEIIKQFVYSLYIVDGVAKWDYQWYMFPFHFCSLAMYVGLIAGIIKKGKVQDYLLSFLVTFGMFGGLIVMFVPSQVLCYIKFVNVQTMVHHGSMIVVATVILAGKHIKLDFKTLLKGSVIFLICLTLGLTANIMSEKVFAIQEEFNMFFISPYVDCPMPVFNIVYKSVPYVIFLLTYIVGFCVGVSLVMYIIKLFIWLTKLLIGVVSTTIKNKKSKVDKVQ